MEGSERQTPGPVLEGFPSGIEGFGQVAENMRAVLWIVNLETAALLYVSPAFEAIWGRTRQSLVERGNDAWLETVHPEDRARIQADSPRQLRGEPVIREYRIVRPDGSIRHVREHSFLLKDPAGQGHRLAGIAEDVTERYRLEDQFRQAQKMEAVGRLAGGVAHDFNNLLTVMLGYTDVALAKLREADPLRPILDQVRKAGDRAADLTRQLLAFSRRQVLVPVVLNLNVVLDDMEKMLRRLIGEDIEFQVNRDPGLWTVKADPGQLEQVVMNLAVNARDAMPQGGQLTLETRNVEVGGDPASGQPTVPPGAYVLLTVADTGSGMDDHTRERVFEPFFTTKGERGTGLGLATVYGIVAQSGGHIDVESEPDKGSMFRIYLPRCRERPTTGKSHPGVATERHGSETLLLVEDEDGVRQLACLVLRQSGYRVLEARSGGDALLTCERHPEPIQLLVTDVVMPQMSGRQLAERLAVMRPQMRVLYLSGYTDEALAQHGVLDPETAFLAKPFHPAALARKVREVLDSVPGDSLP